MATHPQQLRLKNLYSWGRARMIIEKDVNHDVFFSDDRVAATRIQMTK